MPNFFVDRRKTKMLRLKGVTPSLTLAVLLLAVYSAFAADAPDMTMHRTNVGELDETGWTTAKSTEGKFSVRLPNTFNDFTTRSKDPDSPADRVFVVGTVIDGIKFAALRNTYTKPDGANYYYNRFVNGETFTGAKRIIGKYKGYPFAEIVTSDGRGTFYMRSVLVQEDLVTMMIEEPVTQKGVGATLKTTFFESLTFDP